MRIGHHQIGSSRSPFIIAEIGVNHDGSEARAGELIHAAADCGADAVKFQYFTAERLLSRAATLADYQRAAGATDSFSMLQELELSLGTTTRVAEHVLSIGLHPIVTVFSVEHVPDMRRIPWAAFKIASPDIINRPLIDAVRASDKPVILSTGAATLEEIRQALTWVGDGDFALMQCVSAYPTPHESAQLGSILALQQAFDTLVGYSDHTTDELTGGLAVAAGAVMLEKHLTIDRSASGPDHAMSLDPAAFKRYVEFSRRAADMLGEHTKDVQDLERNVREVARQSIVTTRMLKAGAVIRRGDLTLKRPAAGLPPVALAEVIGRTVSVDVEADVPLTGAHLRAEPTRKRISRRTNSAARAA